MAEDVRQVTIYMTPEMRDEIDQARGYQSRSQWIIEACRLRLSFEGKGSEYSARLKAEAMKTELSPEAWRMIQEMIERAETEDTP